VYQTGDIVLISTVDAVYGKVEVPAVVRYYCEHHGSYEVNALVCAGDGCASGASWWTVRPHEIDRYLARAFVQRNDPTKER